MLIVIITRMHETDQKSLLQLSFCPEITDKKIWGRTRAPQRGKRDAITTCFPPSLPADDS